VEKFGQEEPWGGDLPNERCPKVFKKGAFSFNPNYLEGFPKAIPPLIPG